MTDRSEVAVLGAGFGGLASRTVSPSRGSTTWCSSSADDGVGGTWRVEPLPRRRVRRALAPVQPLVRTEPPLVPRVTPPNPRSSTTSRTATTASTSGGRSAPAPRSSPPPGAMPPRAGSCATGGPRPRGVRPRVGHRHVPHAQRASIPGLDEFAGTVFHSARWDTTTTSAGDRVAVIGTGASAIQVVPAIVDRTTHLDLYQRSAPWVLPRRDPPYTPEQQRAFAERPEVAARHRQELHDLFEQTTVFLSGDPTAAMLAAMAHQYLERKVLDPVLRAKLTPRHPFGCTRTLVSSDYYPAVQHDHVDVITDGIDRITADGDVTADGVERAADSIVLCTGFRAVGLPPGHRRRRTRRREHPRALGGRAPGVPRHGGAGLPELLHDVRTQHEPGRELDPADPRSPGPVRGQRARGDAGGRRDPRRGHRGGGGPVRRRPRGGARRHRLVRLPPATSAAHPATS